MNPGENYTLTVHGKRETGLKENFLRRRNSDEILASGLSSGCGDYAVTFLQLMEKQGVETRLVDGAEISTASLATHFSGHAVVAVRQPGQTDWWLANPTDQTILSKHWSTQAQHFRAFGSHFWIGYCGSLASYPIHNANDLMRFYTRTLNKVPLAFLNQHLYRLNFTVDPSLRDENGAYRNPNLANFLSLQPQILKAYKVHPTHQVTVRLVRGKNDSESDLGRLPDGRWRGVIGLRSGCSPRLFSYFEQRIEQ
jgi:hypothetical protein